MKLAQLRIKNYRSCKDLPIDVGEMHALVGANNSGKSSILRALDFLFNPSVSKIDEEAFWNGDTSLEIWIEAVFSDLSGTEEESLGAYLRPDGTFHMARSATITTLDEDTGERGDQAAGKVESGQHYCKLEPKMGWLRPSEINGTSIGSWWQEKESLVANGVSFVEFVGGKRPNVTEWKEFAARFVEEALSEDDFEVRWSRNPKGYSNVLKATLPLYIMVPAVRDVTEEIKVTKSSPLGRILSTVIRNVTENQRKPLEDALDSVRRKLNKEGGGERIESVTQVESRLNAILGDYMECDLEIEFQSPTLEMLLSTPRLHADDGFRNIVENKGHGLQRAIIFSILRYYSELMVGELGERSRTLIFAIEEPELYMHPQAQRTIRRVLRDLANEGDQVIFSTHSALLVDVAYFDEVIRVEGRRDEEAQDDARTVTSRVWQLPMSKMIADLKDRYPRANPTAESMRELYSHAYHPLRAEGFFARLVVLVEGPTEAYSLPIYADAMGYPFDKNNVAVVEAGGKGPMDRLYRVFNELGIPCYMIFDYDQNSSKSGVVRKSRELLELLGASTDVPETNFVGESFAVFPDDWETDVEPEIEDYDALAADAKDLLGDCGKPLVARYVARRRTEGEEAQIPGTIERIVDMVRNLSWRGSCLRDSGGDEESAAGDEAL